MRKTLLVLCICVSIGVKAQEDSSGWKLSAGAGYAPGFITENTQTNQLTANFAFEKESFGIKLDGYYFLNAQGDRPRFNYNHQIYLGGYYKFFDTKIYPVVGAKVGLAFAESNEYGILNQTSGEIEFQPAISPLSAISLGVQYDAEDWIYLFLEGQQIFGKHISNSYATYLDELRFSIGIGFHLINKTTN